MEVNGDVDADVVEVDGDIEVDGDVDDGVGLTGFVVIVVVIVFFVSEVFNFCKERICSLMNIYFVDCLDLLLQAIYL